MRKPVELLLRFPANIKAVLAKAFCVIAEREFNTHEKIRDFKSLGKEKVLALYKSQSQRRSYDNDPNMRRAMNYLMILDSSDQFFLASKLMELMEVTRDYLVICKRYASSPQVAVVENIARAFIEEGAREARAFLRAIHQEFQRLFTNLSPPFSSRAPGAGGEPDHESLTDSNAGMRIRTDPDFA